MEDDERGWGGTRQQGGRQDGGRVSRESGAQPTPADGAPPQRAATRENKCCQRRAGWVHVRVGAPPLHRYG
jgi:hypothetical protein